MLTCAGVLILVLGVKLFWEHAYNSGWRHCYEQFFTSGDFEVRSLTGRGVEHW
jgi:hypothetical protein